MYATSIGGRAIRIVGIHDGGAWPADSMTLEQAIERITAPDCTTLEQHRLQERIQTLQAQEHIPGAKHPPFAGYIGPKRASSKAFQHELQIDLGDMIARLRSHKLTLPDGELRSAINAAVDRMEVLASRFDQVLLVRTSKQTTLGPSMVASFLSWFKRS